MLSIVAVFGNRSSWVLSMYNKQKEKRAIFICSPNIGLLDNWLPVLQTLNTYYGYKLTIVFPTKKILQGLHDNPVLAALAKQIFDEYIYKPNEFTWARSTIIPAYLDQKQLKIVYEKGRNKLSKIIFLSRVRNKNSFDKKSFSKIVNNSFINESSVLLYDVYEDSKDYNSVLISYLKELKKFSISHALSLPSNDSLISPNISNCDDTNKFCFLFSSLDVQKYQNLYGIPKSNLYVTGIPRHSIEWVNKLLGGRHESIPFPSDKYVFLISRPSNERFYLPRNRKLQYLKEIKEFVIDRHDLSLVIKKHPGETGESDDDVFKEALGQESFQKTWVFSSLHSYILATNAKFSITFYSGISIDMAALRVPSIERINLSGLEAHDTEKSYKSENGEPISPYSYYCLTTNALNKKDFKYYIDKCIYNPSELTGKSHKSYQEIFPIKENCIDYICHSIDEKLAF